MVKKFSAGSFINYLKHATENKLQTWSKQKSSCICIDLFISQGLNSSFLNKE